MTSGAHMHGIAIPVGSQLEDADEDLESCSRELHAANGNVEETFSMPTLRRVIV